jgi:sister chromatid cohesion protein DCC1
VIDKDLLTGLAVLDTNSRPTKWYYLPVDQLSHIPHLRFTQLFDLRPRWKLEEIKPYVTDICQPGETLDQLLLKQSRPITMTNKDGTKSVVYIKK